MAKKSFFLFLATLWVTAFFGLISATSGYTSLKLKSKTNRHLLSLTPQGWGFFTRNPREENIIMYKFDEKDSVVKITDKNFSFNNYFGLSRKQRYEAIQMSALLSDIKEEEFVKCNEISVQNCDINKVIISNNTKNKNNYFKGTYFLKKEKAIPWAWSKSKEKLKNPYKVIEIEIE